jgi:hypothetical protein
MRRPGIITRSFVSTGTAARPGAPVPPQVVATAAPTPQYRRHHNVTAPQVDSTAFRPGWRVATRLDSLFEAGRIDREAWDCAHEWRRWAETIVPSRVQQWAIRVDMPHASARDAGMLWRIAAATKLREAGEALGELRVKLLEASVLHDLSWRAIATQLRCSDKTALDRVAEAVTALADWRCGRIVPPPPVMRYRIEPGRQ